MPAGLAIEPEESTSSMMSIGVTAPWNASSAHWDPPGAEGALGASAAAGVGQAEGRDGAAPLPEAPGEPGGSGSTPACSHPPMSRMQPAARQPAARAQDSDRGAAVVVIRFPSSTGCQSAGCQSAIFPRAGCLRKDLLPGGGWFQARKVDPAGLDREIAEDILPH